MIETACNEFVLVIRDENPESDLFIPTQGQIKPHCGTIQAVGDLVRDENIKAGKGRKCLFHRDVGFVLTYEEQDYLVLQDREIIALP